jgi:hypothetical protein
MSSNMLVGLVANKTPEAFNDKFMKKHQTG